MLVLVWTCVREGRLGADGKYRYGALAHFGRGPHLYLLYHAIPALAVRNEILQHQQRQHCFDSSRDPFLVLNQRFGWEQKRRYSYACGFDVFLTSPVHLTTVLYPFATFTRLYYHFFALKKNVDALHSFTYRCHPKPSPFLRSLTRYFRIIAVYSSVVKLIYLAPPLPCT